MLSCARYVRSIMLAIMLCLMAGVIVPHAAMAQIGTQTANPTGSAAQSNPQTTNGQGGTKGCRASYPEAAGGVLLGVVVPCISRTMEDTSSVIADTFIAYMWPVVLAYITLAVVMFGIKVVEGQPSRLKGEAFLLIFKIAMILTLLNMVGSTLIPAAYDTVLSAQTIVGSAIDASAIHCPIAQYGDANTPLLWKEMDCALGKLFGFMMGNHPDGSKGPNMLLMASAFGMLGGFVFGGTFGVALFMVVIGVLVSALLVVLRTAMAFINGFMHVSIMLILSPIFMPLTLMRATQTFFDTWWRSILGGIVTPIVVAVYATMALQLYDAVLFAPNSMFQNLFNPQFTKYVQAMPTHPCGAQVTGTPGFLTSAFGTQNAQQISNSILMKNSVMPFLNGASSPCNALQKPNLDVSKITNAAGQPYNKLEDWFFDMFKDALKIFITSWLIYAGFKYALQAAQNFSGSFVAAGSVIANPIGDKIDSAIYGINNQGGIQGAMKQNFIVPATKDTPAHDASGTEFIERLPTLPKNVMTGFVGGLSGERE